MPILRGILANFRTAGIHGFRPQNLSDGDLQQNGRRHYFELPHVHYCPYMECWIWSTYLWLYDKAGCGTAHTYPASGRS